METVVTNDPESLQSLRDEKPVEWIAKETQNRFRKIVHSVLDPIRERRSREKIQQEIAKTKIVEEFKKLKKSGTTKKQRHVLSYLVQTDIVEETARKKYTKLFQSLSNEYIQTLEVNGKIYPSASK
eukprot:COSAG01_NODE_71_length_28648_cov_1587.432449_25_plen_126_part_00